MFYPFATIFAFMPISHRTNNKQEAYMKFAIYGNAHQSKKNHNITNLLETLGHMGDSYAIESTFYHFLKAQYPRLLRDTDILDDGYIADVAISYGGDGTFLRTAGKIGNSGCPILGINAGRLGFLTTISHNDIEETIQNLHDGKYSIEERSLIEVETNGNTLHNYPYALNEIAVMKHDSSSMIKIETTINEKDTITYQADGLIIATPSGSTGYSLSVGGPIISPNANIMVLTPIAPHSLNMRPIVLNNDTVISIKVSSRSRNFLIAIDGRNESCSDDTTLTIRKASYNLRIIRDKERTFIKNLQEKMMWGTDIRE